jgi:hypothetical protein
MRDMASVRRWFGTVVVVGSLAAGAAARADEERARAYLAAARDDIKNGNYDSVERDLELMAEQFEGVADAVKKTLTAEADAVRNQAADAKFVAQFDDADKKLAEILADKDVAKATKAFAANPTGDDEKARFGSVVRTYERFEEEVLKKLPAGHPRTKAVAAKFEAAATPVQKMFLNARKAALSAELAGVWEKLKGQAAQLKDNAPPAYDKWVEGPDIVAADRSLKMAVACGELLDNAEVKQFEKAFAADDPAVAKLLAAIRAERAASAAKVMAEAAAYTAAAERAKPVGNAETRMKQLAGELEKLRGTAGQPEAVARIAAVTKGWEEAARTADAGQQAKIDEMQASAKTRWAEAAKQYDGKTEAVDPTAALGDIGKYRGKLVRFTDKANVAGNAFGAPDYAYVATVDNRPMAFRFTPKGLAAANRWRDFNGGRPISLGDFRDVVGRVVGVGKVNILVYDAVRDTYVVAGQTDCPVLEMVGFYSRYVTFDETKGSNVEALK